MWDYVVHQNTKNIIDKRRSRKLSLNPPTPCFAILFIISCIIELDVSKKSTASSTPFDRGEDETLIDCMLFLGHAENQWSYKDLGSKSIEKNHCGQLLPLIVG